MTDEPQVDRDLVRENRRKALEQVFTPDAPISPELFRGRIAQRDSLMSAIRRTGAHAAVFGEPGLGKTSLSTFAQRQVESEAKAIVFAHTCDTSDSFEGIWTRVLAHAAPGSEFSCDNATDICNGISTLDKPVVCFVDEFHMLENAEASRFASVIKQASDRRLQLTVVIIGVADSIATLLESHATVHRCLQEIMMPRMTTAELGELVESGLRECGFTIGDDQVVRRLTSLCVGMPYYGHLLAQNIGFAAADKHTEVVTSDLVKEGVARAIDNVQLSVSRAFGQAVDLASIDFLIGLASTGTDEYGYFQPNIVDSDQDTIDTLCAYKVLAQENGRWRYRFCDPLLPPFVILKGRPAHG